MPVQAEKATLAMLATEIVILCAASDPSVGYASLEDDRRGCDYVFDRRGGGGAKASSKARDGVFVRRGGVYPLPSALCFVAGGDEPLPYRDPSALSSSNGAVGVVKDLRASRMKRYSVRRLRSFGRCRSLKDDRRG